MAPNHNFCGFVKVVDTAVIVLRMKILLFLELYEYDSFTLSNAKFKLLGLAYK